MGKGGWESRRKACNQHPLHNQIVVIQVRGTAFEGENQHKTCRIHRIHHNFD